MSKTIRIPLLFCLLVLACSVFSQSNNSSDPLRAKLMNAVMDYNQRGFKVIRIEMGEVYKNKSVVILRELTLGKTYEIRAFTHEDELEDVTLKVFQKKEGRDWMLQTQDIGNIPGARVQFPPNQYDLYKIILRGYKFNNTSKGKYALVIAITD